MSRATKRKHVVLGTPGNNLHEVETAEGTRFLASMPPRFRRHIWIKRGDFLLVDPIEEGTKVKAEMSLVLLPPPRPLPAAPGALARGLHTPGEVEPPGGPPPCRGRGPLR
ncbi:probable RNA-binding protein EIF1AD isoform X2 [Aquila chrysaetos chrysaetos]|uniref:probable RNA-binding protein EIF1AD isoform X2 n=1 Tax=Aquila chrysaetos chrysaetos TaxID=223781 RepID=UPI001176CBDA|nr:probable RNA-binding protein EIF1AD isoform X2 [Aquila chrysaetos chrysaetos]